MAAVVSFGVVSAVGARGSAEQRPYLVPIPSMESAAVPRRATAPVPDEADRYRAAPPEEGQPPEPRSTIVMGERRTPPAPAKPTPKPKPKPRPKPARITVATASLRRPTLVWKAVPGAAYYNLIVWRDGARVLDLWPARPRALLPTNWQYQGKSRKLAPGRYLWFAYPGFGPRAEARYGEPVQSGVLVIERK